MICPIHTFNKSDSFAVKLILASALMLTASVASAEESTISYVDSVHNWGAWGLDIEPAAGGLSQPATQALNARNTKVALRTNSISALAPPASPKSPVVFSPPSAPIVPTVVPVTPPTPPVTPPSVTAISPNVPIPVGAP